MRAWAVDRRAAAEQFSFRRAAAAADPRCSLSRTAPPSPAFPGCCARSTRKRRLASAWRRRTALDGRSGPADGDAPDVVATRSLRMGAGLIIEHGGEEQNPMNLVLCTLSQNSSKGDSVLGLFSPSGERQGTAGQGVYTPSGVSEAKQAMLAKIVAAMTATDHPDHQQEAQRRRKARTTRARLGHRGVRAGLVAPEPRTARPLPSDQKSEVLPLVRTAREQERRPVQASRWPPRLGVRAPQRAADRRGAAVVDVQPVGV